MKDLTDKEYIEYLERVLTCYEHHMRCAFCRRVLCHLNETIVDLNGEWVWSCKDCRDLKEAEKG